MCLDGPFAECLPGGHLGNECPDFPIEKPSSSSGIGTSSSSSNIFDSLFSSSSEIIEISNCEDFDPTEKRLHFGMEKKQICDKRDGTRYVYVPIGKQTWLAENLRYNAEGSICFNNIEKNCTNYGRMYRFQNIFCDSEDCQTQWGVVDPDKLGGEVACPEGWHLPSTGELEELWTTSDPNFVPGSEASGIGNNSSGKKLKVKAWNGTDDYGFAALPGGYCGDGCGNFYQINNMSFWWHYGFGAPVPLTKSWRLTTSSTNGGDAVDDAFQSYGTSAFYVRCLKTVAQTTPSPETPPANLACSGAGTGSQKCHLGKWKDHFTDARDGQEYPYVNINGKDWMAKNLNFNENKGSVCYNGLAANCEAYGRLYNWGTAMGLPPASQTCVYSNPGSECGKMIGTTHQGVCPEGWHIPNKLEWDQLGDASAALKAKSGWEQNGTDEHGFAALPGSYGVSLEGYYSRGGFGTARAGFWWSKTPMAANGSNIRHIGPTSANVTSIDNDFSRLYSVRCVKD
jgi:uncharacterized protein (TIGR02145 family)